MKKLRFTLILVLLMMALTINCYADAHVYDVNECDVVVAFIQGHNGSIEEYTKDLYDYGGFRPDGIILVVDTSAREYSIITSGTCIDKIPDSSIYKIEEQVIPYLSSGDWNRAEAQFVASCKAQLYSGIKGLIAKLVACLGVGAALGGTPLLRYKKQMQTVKSKTTADDYIKAGSLSMIGRNDRFVNAVVTKTKIPQTNNSHGPPLGGSHPGSTITMGSSGIPHGGHSGKF